MQVPPGDAQNLRARARAVQRVEDARAFVGDLASEEADGPDAGAEPIACRVWRWASPTGGLGGVTAACCESRGEPGEDVAGAGGSESYASTGGRPAPSVWRRDMTVERHDCTSGLRGRGRLTIWISVAGEVGGDGADLLGVGGQHEPST